MSAVRFGVSLHRVDDVAGEARQLEDWGYDYVTSGEHVSFNIPTPKSFVSLSVAAGATERIRLLSTIALVPLYPAALLAKLGAALDVASGGRFELGVGIGGEIPREFEACGVPIEQRGARTNEALQVIRRLWTEPTVDFDGQFNQFSGVSIEPRPRQRPHPPIWISGRQDAAMRRAARHGDGWLPYMFTPEMLASSLERISLLRADTERAGEPVEPGVFLFFSVHPDRRRAHEMAVRRLSKQYAQDFSGLVDRYVLAGTPDDVVRRLEEFVDV